MCLWQFAWLWRTWAQMLAQYERVPSRQALWRVWLRHKGCVWRAWTARFTPAADPEGVAYRGSYLMHLGLCAFSAGLWQFMTRVADDKNAIMWVLVVFDDSDGAFAKDAHGIDSSDALPFWR